MEQDKKLQRKKHRGIKVKWVGLSKGVIVNILLFGVFFTLSEAKATILWAGGEDIDFPNGAPVCEVSNNAAYFRTGYSRTAIYTCSGNLIAKSNTFSGGAVTSAWLSIRLMPSNNVLSNYITHGKSAKYAGFMKSGTNNSLWIGNSSSDATKYALWKYDGTTWTQLAVEAVQSLALILTKVDMHVTNYSDTVNGTVNIYLNGSANATLSYTGNLTTGGSTNFDSVAFMTSEGTAGIESGRFSEFIVSDSDTRAMSLVTLSPNAAGDSNTWVGAYTDVDEFSNNIADGVYTGTAGNDFLSNLTGLPGANFSIKGVKISASTSKSGTGISSISLGIKTNSSASVPVGVTLSEFWSNTETYYQTTNPITTNPWSVTDINNLQINLRSGN